jgi:hypothetical protein
MNELATQSETTPIEELPERIAHRRKVAERIALDTPEYAADDPSRKADTGGDRGAMRHRGVFVAQSRQLIP